MVQNPHRDIAVRQGDLVQNMAASRLKPISCRQEDGILFSSFASFVSPSLMWRGFLVTLGQAASTPASTSFHSARFASLLYCPLLRRLRQHRSGTLPLQPRPASTPPAFCAARPLAICRPSGKPSPQAASAAVASRRASLRRRRLRRRGAGGHQRAPTLPLWLFSFSSVTCGRQRMTKKNLNKALQFKNNYYFCPVG